MPVIAFYSNCKDQTGNTLSAVSYATYQGIEKNKRILFIDTSINDETVKEAFWETKVKKKSGLFGPNTNLIAENGIEGLDRVIRSNKITPDIITDYTKVALRKRLEILLGYKGSEKEYIEIQNQYFRIINLAAKCYDTVIVDIDKNLETKTKLEIIKASDIIIALTTQKMENIQDIFEIVETGQYLKKINTIITLGKYDSKSKYNIKNITRNVLKQKEPINTIPYNTGLFEAVQEGKIIDLFIKYLGIRIKDDNTFFIDEIKRLEESIEQKIKEMQMMQ